MTGTTPFHSGTVSIGSSKPLPLAGYGARDISARSDEARLEANWICFGTEKQTHHLIAIDALFSSDTLEAEIRQQLALRGLDAAHIIIVASHTHYAPSLDPFKPRLGAADMDHIREVAKRIAQDIQTTRESQSALRPVAWYWGEARNAGSVYRRATQLQLSARSWPPVRIANQIAPNPAVEIDQALRLWIARTADETPVFAVATWPCHATSRADSSVASPDFVAPLRDALRRHLGQSVPVAFLPGASGDIRPGFWQERSLKRWLYPYPFQRSFAPPSPQTEAAFDDSLKATVNAALAAPMTQLDFSHSFLTRTEFPLADLMAGTDARHVPLYRAVIGGVEIIGVGAEISAGWTSRLGLASCRQRQILSGCVGRVFGYLPTEEQVLEGGYEVNGFRRGFGISGAYQPGADITRVMKQAMLETGSGLD